MRSRRGSVPISYDLLSPTRASSGGDNRHLGHPRPIDVKTVSHARRTGPTRNQIPWRIDKPPLNLKLEQLRIVTLGSAHIGRVRRQNDTVEFNFPKVNPEIFEVILIPLSVLLNCRIVADAGCEINRRGRRFDFIRMSDPWTVGQLEYVAFCSVRMMCASTQRDFFGGG